MLATALLLWQGVKTGNPTPQQGSRFTKFMDAVDQQKVADVTIYGSSEVRGTLKDNTHLKTVVPANYPDLIGILRKNGVVINVKENSNSSWVSILVNASPFLLLIGFW